MAKRSAFSSIALVDEQPTMADDRARALILAPPKVTARENFAQAIAVLWQNAEECFLAIGRRLNEAKESLPHGEFQRLVQTDLPFTYPVANKLMRVAAAVDA